MRYYVIINGVNSLTIEGLAIKTLPPISKPAMRNLREEIDGRDGDITTELGYGAYDKTLEIGLYGNYDINKIIAFFNSKGKIIFSDEPDKYYNFEIVDKIDYTKLVKFRTAMINIHCQPFKYPVSEEPQVEEYEYVEATGTNVTLDNTSEAIFNKIDLLGNTEQTQYTGNNLLIPHAQATGSTNGITRTTNADGSITLTGTATANAYLRISEPIQLQSNTAYTTLIQDQALPANVTLYYNNLENIGTDYASTYMPPSSRAKSYTTGNVTGTTSIAVLVQSGATVNVTLKPMLVKGTYTTETIGDFEPYVGGIPSPNPNYPQDIHVVSGNNTIEITGRNQININGIYSTSSQTNLQRSYENGIATLTWISGFSLYMTEDDSTNQPINLKSATQTYTISFLHKGNALNLRFDESNTNIITTTNDNDYKRYSYTFTGLSSLVVKFVRDDNTGTAYLKDFQIEKGSQATDYEPYQSQSLPLNLGTLEMVSIPNTNNRDYFYKDNEGNWYKKALIEKIIIDGTESTWVENSATKGLFQITLTNTKNSPNTINAVSDWLRGAKGNDIGAATITNAINNTIATYNGNRLFFRLDQYKNNLAGLKTYIQSNNLTAYYLYGTPVDVAITDETLAEQLEAIKNAISYTGQTNISQTNNDMPFILDLSALKENSDHLVIDNIGNIYSKPTLDLEGTGIVDIYLNDTQMFQVDLSEKNEIVIDTEKMEAYNPTDNTLANRQVTGDYSKFKLDSGENDLRFSGDLTKATITNYERWL